MASNADMRLCVLWEGELRSAAALLRELSDKQDTDAFPELAVKALNACLVALHGLDDKSSVVLISNDAVKTLKGKYKRSAAPSGSADDKT